MILDDDIRCARIQRLRIELRKLDDRAEQRAQEAAADHERDREIQRELAELRQEDRGIPW